MSAARRTAAAAAGMMAGVLALAGCSGGKDESDRPSGPEPAPVELVALSSGDPLRVGVLVTTASEPGQGADLLPAVAGAQVAAGRLRLGGGEVELEVVDDKGTADGALDAVEELLAAGVSGIVVGTTGDHVVPALEKATAAGTAVLAPYLRDAELAGDGLWLTGPDAEATDAALLDAMATAEVSSPAVVTGDGVSVGVEGPLELEVDAGAPAAQLGRIGAAARDGAIDSVVVAASTRTQARLVAALQGRLPDLPIFLTPEALSPTFAEALVEAGGTTSGPLVSVGTDATDATTLSAGAQGEAVAAYFSALRLLAGDDEVLDLFEAAPFADVAAGADVASHDAVVALAVAAAEAESTEPDAVRAALTGTIEPAAGVAGPALDFSAGTALPRESVVALHATTQDPGVRPAGPGAAVLRWFAAPAAEG